MVNVLMIEDDPEFATLLSEYLSKFNKDFNNNNKRSTNKIQPNLRLQSIKQGIKRSINFWYKPKVIWV